VPECCQTLSKIRGSRQIRLHRARPQLHKLQSSSHEILDSQSAILLAADPNEFVRQPSDVRATQSSYILHVSGTTLESLSDSVNAVDQDFLLPAPDGDALDDLVKICEPVCRRQERLSIAIVRCGA
jgi:hypothetical protein